MARRQQKHRISVDHVAVMVGKEGAVGVAVKSHTQLGMLQGDLARYQLRMQRAAPFIDVPAVGRAADRHDLRAQIGEQPRADFVGGPVGAIENNFHAPGFFIHLAVHLAQVDLLLQPIHVRCVQPGSILQG